MQNVNILQYKRNDAEKKTFYQGSKTRYDKN